MVRRGSTNGQDQSTCDYGAWTLKLLFAGTPAAALPSLETLLKSQHDVIGVLTRPPARAGRGKHLVESPVAELARQHNVPVFTPRRVSDQEFLEQLAALAPECCPIVAYGNLIPPAALQIPQHGWVNLHFSLLPAWRGAAPVQHAILHGDDLTGATTFQLDKGLDTGPIYGTVTESIQPTDTAGALLDRLANLGAGLLKSTVDGIGAGVVQAVAQAADAISVAPKITVSDARVRWADPAQAVARRIRACTPAPGAWSTFRGHRVKLGPVTLSEASPLAPGVLQPSKAGVLIGTGSAPVFLGDVQAEGKRKMPAADWARGVRPPLSDVDRFD